MIQHFTIGFTRKNCSGFLKLFSKSTCPLLPAHQSYNSKRSPSERFKRPCFHLRQCLNILSQQIVFHFIMLTAALSRLFGFHRNRVSITKCCVSSPFL
ncbi:hypothetical protein CW304_17540 [Bacillus sp. UFRGS-B20]|nr:hypothetical protein CW304_17540 [Bacillus sp. UFRGS-B20]